MYTEHFGLKHRPFDTTADPRVFYANAVYREAYATVLYGVREHKGLVLLTGEVGTGKTTVLRRAVTELEPEIRCVLFSSPMPGDDDVLGMVCEELRLAEGDPSGHARLRRLRVALEADVASGRTTALLVDEAQNLGDVALEHLRLLSNLETSRDKLLQIVLVGQPELEATLDRHTLRQLRQRIAMRGRLERLTTDREVAAFIEYRLTAAGYRGRALFPPRAITLIAQYSGGLPRLINTVCDNALLTTFARDASQVAPETIDEVAADLRLTRVDDATRAAPPLAVTADEPAGAGADVTRASRRRRPPARPARAAWAVGALAVGISGVAIGAFAWGLTPADVMTRVEPAARSLRGFAERVGLDWAGWATAPEVPPATAAALVPPVAPPSLPERQREDEPVSASPAAPAARDEATGRGRSKPSLVIQRGATVVDLVQRHYGDDWLLAMDLVHELNPTIVDVDRILAGDRLWLPPLDPEGLLRRQTDGTYHLIVATLRDDAQARRLGRALEARGYTTKITRRALSRKLTVSRVTILGLPDRATATRAVQTGRQVFTSVTRTTKESRE